MKSEQSSTLNFQSPYHTEIFQPRTGCLSFPHRDSIETPNHVPISSRGAIPHVSQDVMREQTGIQCMYAALEDFIEKQLTRSSPPILSTPTHANTSPLRTFISLNSTCLLILGPRRIPPLPCPTSSTSTAISVVTSLGFNMLECEDYIDTIKILRPDIVIAMGDVVFGQRVGVKRMDCMGDRSLTWVSALLDGLKTQIEPLDRGLEPHIARPAVFAPMLPIARDVQTLYLDALIDEEQMGGKIQGLALYDIDSIENISPDLRHLPRLYMGDLATPHHLLDAVNAGVDILTAPFVNEATDAGIALNFFFDDIPSDASDKRPLGLDLWSVSYATDLGPLSKTCHCYTCTSHHCAFVQHLLNAKEMLGWVLLQIHNHCLMDKFFEAIRQGIGQGTFESSVQSFKRSYAQTLPIKTGQGPRVRGYTFKSEGKGEPKKNPKPWSASMNDRKERIKEKAMPNSRADAADLEELGFAAIFKDMDPVSNVA